MNKKFFILLVILLIASTTFVSAQSNDTLKSAPDYSTGDFIVLEKLWVGDNDTARPDSITIDIIADGNVLQTVTLTKANNWQFSERLLCPINNTDGSKIVYTFKENGADDYELSSVENGDVDFSLTNTYIGKNNDNTTN